MRKFLILLAFCVVFSACGAMDTTSVSPLPPATPETTPQQFKITVVHTPENPIPPGTTKILAEVFGGPDQVQALGDLPPIDSTLLFTTFIQPPSNEFQLDFATTFLPSFLQLTYLEDDKVIQLVGIKFDLGSNHSIVLPVGPPELVSVSLTPLDAVVKVGDVLDYAATGTYADGSSLALDSPDGLWSSSNPAAATVDSNGRVTAVGPGVTTISVLFDSVTTSTTLQVEAVIPGLTLVSLAVAPTNVSLVSSGRTRNFTVSGTYSDGSVKDLTARAEWSSTKPAVAVVSNAAATKGQVRTVGLGDVQIRAAVDGKIGIGNVTVIVDTVARYTQAARSFAVSSGPWGIALGDVNGDGHLDLAAANRFGFGASVLLGNGDGSFQDALNVPIGTAGTGCTGILLGDVNNDGRPDLVTANQSTVASVLLGNGDGTFQAERTFPTGFGGSDVAVGDVNGDGRPDLVTANSLSNNVSVLLGNGDGTFQTAQNFAVDPGPTGVVLVDLNGDFFLDIATANSNVDNVSVLLGDGSGSFRAPQSFATGMTPFDIAQADLNGDGRVDLVTANQGSNNASVLLGNGDGTFQAAQNLAVGTGPSGVALADVNGDGRPDLVTGNQGENNLTVRIGQGDGTFLAVQSFAVGDAPIGVVVGDLNGDGCLDLANTNQNSNSASVLLQVPVDP